MTAAGLSDVVRYGRLRHRVDGRTVPYAATCFDDEMLTAVDGAIVRWVPLAIVLPLPGTATPVLLGAAAVVGAVTRRRRLDVIVAVASKQLTHRTLYDQLFLEDQRLRDFIPRARVELSGAQTVVGRPSNDSGGRLLMVTDPTRLAGHLDGLEALVLDSSACDPAALRPFLGLPAAGKPVVYLTSSPLDPALAEVRAAGGVVWSWDAGDLGPLSAPASPGQAAGASGTLAASAELLAASGGAARRIWLPDADGDLDAATAALWRALSALSSGHGRLAPGKTHELGAALRWVWAVFNTVSLLPVAPDVYDAALLPSPYAMKLGAAQEQARAYARHAPPGMADPWFRVADAVADVLAAAALQPKLPRVAAWAADIAEDLSRSGVIVTRNRTAAQALARALNDLPTIPLGWQERVAVTTVSAVLSGRVAGVAELLLCGPVQRSASGLLAMPPASSVTVVAAGTWEGTRVRKQVTAAAGALRSLRTETVTMSAPQLAVPPRRTDLFGDDPEITAFRSGGGPAPLPAHPEAPVWEPFGGDVIAALLRQAGADRDELPPAPARDGGAAGDRGDVAAITVEVGDVVGGGLGSRAFVLLGPNDEVHRRRGTDVARVAAKGLAAGDVLILVDNAARRDLFETVTERLAELPQYAPLVALIGLWHRSAAAAAGTGMSYEQIHAAMVKKGTAITSSATIGTWVRGDVHGPQDPKDVARFAAVVGDDGLSPYARQIGAALGALNSVHRQVGRWLSGQIGGAVHSDAPDDVVDAALGLHVADLVESVSLHPVVAVHHTTTTAAAAVGLVLDEAEAQALGAPPPG